MKKTHFFYWLVLILILTATTAASQTIWHPANQATIEWDQSTLLADDSPIPEGDTVKYKIYLSDGSGVHTEIMEVDTTEATVTFQSEGQFFVGVSAVRYNADGQLLSESLVSWSNIEPSEPFGFIFWYPIKQPTGIRRP